MGGCYRWSDVNVPIDVVAEGKMRAGGGGGGGVTGGVMSVSL